MEPPQDPGRFTMWIAERGQLGDLGLKQAMAKCRLDFLLYAEISQELADGAVGVAYQAEERLHGGAGRLEDPTRRAVHLGNHVGVVGVGPRALSRCCAVSELVVGYDRSVRHPEH